MRIITDSASDLTFDVLKEKNIDLIPLSILIGEESYLDDKKTDMKDFWTIMETQDVKTSQPAPIHFLDLFEEIKKNNEEAIYVSISSSLSGTYSQAMTTKQMVGYDSIYIVDSLSATMGQAQLVLYACQLRDQGYSVKEIVDKLENMKSKVKILACMDTLEYLSKSGRLPSTASTLGDFVKVKPVITINEEGRIQILKMKRGKKKAIKEILDLYHGCHIDPDFPIIPIYSKDPTNCEELIHDLSNIESLSQIGLTIGCHIGPGAFGFVFVEK